MIDWYKSQIAGKPVQIHLLLVLTVTLIYVTLWTYMGLDNAALSDNYGVRNSIERGNSLRGDFTRLFGNLPTLFGNYIDPNGFIGTNLVAIGLNILRVTFVYFIIYFLSKNLFVSFFSATLYSVFPLTGTVFWQGMLGMHFGIVVFLFALMLYVLGHTLEAQKAKAVASISSIIFLAISILVHPSYIVLAFAMPFLMFLIYRKDINLKLNIAWYISLVSIIAVYLVSLSEGKGRNSKAGDFNPEGPIEGYQFVLNEYLELFTRTDAANFSTLSLFIIPLLVLATVAIGRHQFSKHENPGKGLLVFTVIAAVTIIIAAYMPYSISKIKFVDRSLILANAGFSLLLVTLVYYIARSRPLASYLAASALVIIMFTGFYGEMSKKSQSFKARASEQETIIGNLLQHRHDLRNKLVLIDFEKVKRKKKLRAKGFYDRPYIHLAFYTREPIVKLNAYSLPFSRKIKADLAFFDDRVVVAERRKTTEYAWEDVILYSVNNKGEVKNLNHTRHSKFFKKRGVMVEIPPSRKMRKEEQDARIKRLYARMKHF